MSVLARTLYGIQHRIHEQAAIRRGECEFVVVIAIGAFGGRRRTYNGCSAAEFHHH